MPSTELVCRLALAVSLLGAVAGAQSIGEVVGFQKISDLAGNFTGGLADEDGFGFATCGLGDVDGDGIADMAVGAWGDDDGGTDRGAVWILFLDADGRVRTEAKISDLAGGFTGQLDDDDRFGYAVSPLGDHDGDGVPDMAVGALFDDDGGFNHGAVWILFLQADGTVKAHQKISDTEGGFLGELHTRDYLGSSITFLGDHDGDGVGDIASGAYRDGDGENGTIGKEGSVWVLRLHADGTVKSHTKIGAMVGGFDEFLDTRDNFGRAVAALGDLDGDGIGDLAVGAPTTLVQDQYLGAVWILFLEADATVKSYVRITRGQSGFTGDLDHHDRFGFSLAALGDINADGTTDLAAGAIYDDDGGPGTSIDDRGAVWMLLMNADGTVFNERKISDTEGNFGALMHDRDYLGHGVSSLGDIDGDGAIEMVAGAMGDDAGGPGRGAVYVLDLKAAKTAAFTGLGNGLAGSLGVPVLVGEGALAGGDAMTLILLGGSPFGTSTTVTLHVGVQPGYVPYLGGVLVPDPEPPGFSLSLATALSGNLYLRSRWPTGVPSGAEFYFQFWIDDAGAPQGQSASNGLLAVAP